MAELTGIEPVPADRQSAILPIDHSSGSLPWTRTTISAFRAQRPAIGRRGNFDCQRTGCRGAIRTPVPGFKVQGPATRRPGITLSARLLSRTAHTTPPTHRRCGSVACDPYARDPQVAVISAAIAIDLRCKLDFKAFEFNRLCAHNFGSSEENRTPISALKGPHPGC
jgi:hypothetical protein